MKNKVTILLILLLLLNFCIPVIGSDIIVNINNKNVEFDVEPIIVENRILIPLRMVSEYLEADVKWLSQEQAIEITKANTVHRLSINSKIAYKSVNNANEIVELDTAPMLINGKALVPLRYIADNFNLTVDWKSSARTVNIYTNNQRGYNLNMSGLNMNIEASTQMTTQQIEKVTYAISDKEQRIINGKVAIITADVKIENPYHITISSNNIPMVVKLNNGRFYLSKNDMIVVIEENETQCKVIQVVGSMPRVRGYISKSVISYDKDVIKKSAKYCTISGKLGYTGINGNKIGIQNGACKIIKREGSWVELELIASGKVMWFKLEDIEYNFDTVVIDKAGQA